MVAAEQLISTLTVEQNRDLRTRCQFENAPLSKNTGSSKRLVLVPDDLFQLREEIFRGGKNVVAFNLCCSHDLPDIVPFVKALDLRAGGDVLVYRGWAAQ